MSIETSPGAATPSVNTNSLHHVQTINPLSSVAVSETPTEATKPAEETPKEDPLSSRFAHLTRKEREVMKRERDLKLKEKELEEWKTKYTSYEDRKKKAKESPLDWLKEADIDYDYLTATVLNDGKPTESQMVKELRAEMATLRKELEEKEVKKLSDDTDQRIAAFNQEIKTMIQGESDKYELINDQQAYELVYNTIQQHYEKTKSESEEGKGLILSPEEAADLVENYLEAQAKKLLNLKKLKTQTIPSEGSSKPNVKPTVTAARPNTLTNTIEVPPQKDRKLSREESLAEAAKLIRWE